MGTYDTIGGTPVSPVIKDLPCAVCGRDPNQCECCERCWKRKATHTSEDSGSLEQVCDECDPEPGRVFLHEVMRRVQALRDELRQIPGVEVK